MTFYTKSGGIFLIIKRKVVADIFLNHFLLLSTDSSGSLQAIFEKTDGADTTPELAVRLG